MGDVLVLRRRAGRQSPERWAEPCEQSDIDRDHSAGRNPGGVIPCHLHPVGAETGQRRRRHAPWWIGGDLRDRVARRPRRRRRSSGGTRAACAVRCRGGIAGGAQSLLFRYRSRARRTADGIEDHGREDQEGATGSSRDARWRRLRRSACAIARKRCAPTSPTGSSVPGAAREIYGVVEPE